MTIKDFFQKRFDELLKEAESLEATKRIADNRTYISEELFILWKVKTRNLLSQVCGAASQHFIAFDIHENKDPFAANYPRFLAVKAVFLAVKDDYEGGYLLSLKSLVQAEVFDDELEQAEELLKNGYYTAAAVIVGVVLETGLRELCSRNNIPHAKLDKMNADLAKEGVFNKLTQKQITALADIRNSAAHGKPEEFAKQDVENMIRDVRGILGQCLG